MNTADHNHTSDSWQDLLDDTFCAPESKSQDIPVDQPSEPEHPVLPEEPIIEPTLQRKFYKNPLFWALSGAAVLFLAILIFFLPTILAFSMWPQLNVCKTALDQWQKLDCYNLSSNSYQIAGDDTLSSFHSIKRETLARCGKDWLYESYVSESNHKISSVTLCKDGKHYTSSYNSSADAQYTSRLTPCGSQLAPKLFPLTFSWYGKKLQYKETTYIHEKVDLITISVTEIFGGKQYDLVFDFNSNGAMTQIQQILTDNSSGHPPVTTTCILSSTDKDSIQYFINSYLNLSGSLLTE